MLNLSHSDALAQSSQSSSAHGLAVGSGSRHEDKVTCTSSEPPTLKEAVLWLHEGHCTWNVPPVVGPESSCHHGGRP